MRIKKIKESRFRRDLFWVLHLKYETDSSFWRRQIGYGFDHGDKVTRKNMSFSRVRATLF